MWWVDTDLVNIHSYDEMKATENHKRNQHSFFTFAENITAQGYN